jgi:hypothetical protein
MQSRGFWRAARQNEILQRRERRLVLVDDLLDRAHPVRTDLLSHFRGVRGRELRADREQVALNRLEEIRLEAGGVALRLPASVPPGTHVQVTIPTGFGVVTADAEVVWAEPPDARPRGAPCRHGLRFLRVESSSELPLRLLLAGRR